jgi:ATP-dependent DNA helicase DinG
MAPRNELLDLFRNDAGGAVLFATKSFWEGVDVPGEALSLVIIDKLPFAPHQDPVIQRRGQRVREAGGNPRLNTKRYGPQMIASLPRARRTLRFEDVEGFFSPHKSSQGDD